MASPRSESKVAFRETRDSAGRARLDGSETTSGSDTLELASGLRLRFGFRLFAMIRFQSLIPLDLKMAGSGNVEPTMLVLRLDLILGLGRSGSRQDYRRISSWPKLLASSATRKLNLDEALAVGLKLWNVGWHA